MRLKFVALIVLSTGGLAGFAAEPKPVGPVTVPRAQIVGGAISEEALGKLVEAIVAQRIAADVALFLQATSADENDVRATGPNVILQEQNQRGQNLAIVVHSDNKVVRVLLGFTDPSGEATIGLVQRFTAEGESTFKLDPRFSRLTEEQCAQYELPCGARTVNTSQGDVAAAQAGAGFPACFAIDRGTYVQIVCICWDSYPSGNPTVCVNIRVPVP